jgi:hypothetical protein
MEKFLFTLLGILITGFFAITNMHHVDMGLILGGPMKVRLFPLLLTAYLAGVATAFIVRFYIRSKIKTRRKAKAAENGALEEGAEAEEGEKDIFFFG